MPLVCQLVVTLTPPPLVLLTRPPRLLTCNLYLLTSRCFLSTGASPPICLLFAGDMLSSARRTQTCSGGGHGVAPRRAVAVAVAVAVSRQWGKGAVINRSSSRASRASLLNKSLFGRWPRWPSILTGLPPTVWVAAAAFASCCRIHWRQQRRLATIEAAEGSSRDAAAAVHS